MKYRKKNIFLLIKLLKFTNGHHRSKCINSKFLSSRTQASYTAYEDTSRHMHFKMHCTQLPIMENGIPLTQKCIMGGIENLLLKIDKYENTQITIFFFCIVLFTGPDYRTDKLCHGLGPITGRRVNIGNIIV